ncbi:Heme/copper-type cytochrome/quinol oxidase, subunit 3 [Rhodospirillaceae bacterium LM-1]|nr:Heme/copper-type cytochrome/quinol oxidase, subunit 3 [Rhodospirillaceae bacterium LM-1]
MSQLDANSHEEKGWGALDSLPGNPLIWVLIISELLVFGAFFLGYIVARALDPQMFNDSQLQLDRLLGGLNTMVLITSGYLAAQAVRLRAENKIGASRRWLAGAMGVGSVFLVIKAIEYGDKIEQGIGLETNTFFTLFFLMTGFHMLHVVLGLIILAIVGIHNSLENLETGTAFWHMVDLIWIILYPLVYLIR